MGVRRRSLQACGTLKIDEVQMTIIISLRYHCIMHCSEVRDLFSWAIRGVAVGCLRGPVARAFKRQFGRASLASLLRTLRRLYCMHHSHARMHAHAHTPTQERACLQAHACARAQAQTGLSSTSSTDASKSRLLGRRSRWPQSFGSQFSLTLCRVCYGIRQELDISVIRSMRLVLGPR